MVETVAQDIQYALRLSKRQPVFAVLVVLTLALGIGASTALFSVMDAALLRPLPYPYPEQLVRVWLVDGNHTDRRTGPSIADARNWRRTSTTLQAVGVVRASPETFLVDTGNDIDRATVSEMGEGCLDIYQLPLTLGRAFAEGDQRFGAAPVVMLGHDYWQTHFSGSAEVIGRSIRIGAAQSATVIGVMPRGLYDRSALWRPNSSFTGPDFENRRGMGSDTYARLRPGVTIKAAEAELGALLIGGSQPTSSHSPEMRVLLQPMRPDVSNEDVAVITLLAVAVMLILVISCANVAILLVSRGVTRLPELAIRASIGAGRARLIHQLLTEGAVFGLMGGCIGAVSANVLLETFLTTIPIELPATATASINPSVLAFTLCLSLITSLGFGVAPAAILSSRAIASHASNSPRPLGSVLTRRGGQFLIGAQVSLAIVLLVGVGLLVRSLDRALDVDLGFAPESVLVMYVSPVDQRPGVVSTYYPSLLARLRAHPAVQAAGAVEAMPLSNSRITFGFASSPSTSFVSVEILRTLPGYVESIGLPIKEGFIPTPDWFATTRFAAVNEAAAKILFPSGGAVGQSITFSGSSHEVVAVVGNVRRDGLKERVAPQVLRLSSEAVTEPVEVLIRPKPDSHLEVADLRAIAETVGPRVYVDRIVPATTLLADRLIAPTHRTLLLALLGGLAFVLTLVGIFATTAHSVAQRNREIGLRMAFGAQPSHVVRTIVRDAGIPVVIGIAAGLVGASNATQLIASFLFQTSPTDPATFAIVAISFALAGLLAAWIPARRAARVDPVIALRGD